MTTASDNTDAQAEEKAAELLALAQGAGADAADVVMMDMVDVSVSCRLGVQEELERSESKAMGLRVWVGDRQAIVSSTDISKEAVKTLAERAVAMAKVATEDAYASQAPAELLATSWPDLELFDTVEPSAEALFEQAHAVEDAARSVEGITNSEGADAYFGVYGMTLATSGGFVGSRRSTTHSLSVSVLAGEGAGMERDYDYSTARFASDLEDAHAIGKSAAERTLRRLNPRKASSCQVPVVLDPRISRSLVGTFSGAISGSSIARGTSFLREHLGEQIFAPSIQIIDDPLRVRGLGSRVFDGEGVACKELKLVEDGVLQSWLLDVRTAAQLGMTTTGHASRGLASPPSPSCSNLYMAAGDQSVKSLIGDIQQGFYVTEAFGMGVNTVTGDYSQGAAGYWIENGELAYPVSEITIAGKLLDMFKSAVPADDLDFRYGVNAPTLRIDGMTIAGS